MPNHKADKSPATPVPEGAERRQNLRLRALIDDFRTNIATNQRELEFQFQRIAQIQSDLDRLKQGWEKT